MDTHPLDRRVPSELRWALLARARRQFPGAAAAAPATPYWAPCPASVLGRRSAAAVLRAEADQLLTAS